MVIILQEDIIIKYFQNVGLISKDKYCPKYGDLMNISKRNDTIDKIAFRYHRRNPIHDIKINIRNGTSFENFQVKIQIIYFLIYYCFIENISINTAYEKTKSFCQQLGLTPTTPSIISKLFSVLREKIRISMHSNWEKSLLDL